MKGENDNMKHDHDESDRPVVADCSSSDNGNYSELLELMVKFAKKEMKDVEDPGELISLMDWFDKSHKVKGLHAIRARVVDQLMTTTPRCLVNFWYLMTLLNTEDKQVIVDKLKQYVSSNRAIDDFCNDVENFSELMDLSGTELRKIKQQFPNQIGTMATASELHSTSELFLSFTRGLRSLLFKIKMMEVYILHKYNPRRPELQKLVDRMLASIEDELKQYEQEVEEAGAKIQQVLKENLKKKAVEEKREGDHDDDDATSNEQRQLQSLECKVREWWNIVNGSEKEE